MKPTLRQMEKIQEVSIEEHGIIYDLKPGWRSRYGERVHYILDPVHDCDYDESNDDARSQMKSVITCDCDDCVKSI